MPSTMMAEVTTVPSASASPVACGSSVLRR